MGIAANLWFIAEGLTQETFKRSMMGAIINILLNFLMIPRYGIFGAAISTVVSQAFASFLLNAINSKTRELFWLQVKNSSLYLAGLSQFIDFSHKSYYELEYPSIIADI